MRNLRTIRRSVLSSPDELSLTASAWDAGTDSVICSYGPTKHDSLIQLKRWKPSHRCTGPKSAELEHITSWDAPCPLPDLDCDVILNLQYFSDSSTACIVLRGGDITVVRESPQDGEEKIEIVGSVDAGISAAAWSPDEELLAVTTSADTFLFMTRDFESVTDVTFTSDDLKASKHVSVGWGKAETQFKGKGAKALRDPTMPEKVDEGLLSRHDDRGCTISWRGDGAYVAVNSLQASSRRVIRVYTREGVLDSVSEPVDGLESSVSWRPAGNILAGTQRQENQIDVVFFERNGLRHGQFGLRLSREEMESWGGKTVLKWNVDSSVLAVCLKDRVQLWTMGNYHYYLKQEISLPFVISNDEPVLFEWHPEQALRFTTGSSDSLQQLENIFHVATSAPSPPNDYGIVAVIDGKSLKLTPIRIANVPPPMALHELTLKSSVIDVAILNPNEGSMDAKIAILEANKLSLYHWNFQEKPIQSPCFISVQEIPSHADSKSSPAGEANQQIHWLGAGCLLVLQSCANGNTILTCRIEDDAISFIRSTTNRSYVQGFVTSVSGISSTPYLLAADGQVFRDPALGSVQAVTDLVPRELLATFPKSTYRVEIVDLSNPSLDLTSSGNHTVPFGLTLNGSLFAHERCLAKDCTSFLLTPAHLVFTTTQHLLKFVHLTAVSELEVPPDTPEVDERCRSIERGARLVTVIPSISALVLQMPRGNIETIYPRALVVAAIRRDIDEKRYRKAFLACRNHRVDMNILHDYDPFNFIVNVSLFVDQIRKVEYIDLFLSQLREEDVSKTMYKETLRTSPLSTNSADREDGPKIETKSNTSKVNSICNAILEILQSRTATNLQNIISAHVCKNPPDLEAGLLVVAELQKNYPSKAEKAVEHICFLADVNRLYDNALGLYDLDLALLVAQQSQKDPREYLPFLQNLQGLPLSRRHYTIDDYLGRHTKALEHLYNLNVFEEFKFYVVKHNLYEAALHLSRYQEDDVKGIMALYATYLVKESRYKESGIAYEYLNDFTSAYEAYRLAHLWKESLSSATMVPLEKSALESLARTLADSLVELKDYHPAATIHLDYLNDVETAARIFCQGYFFADATRILGLHQRLDLLETVVDIGLAEGMASMTELLAECKAQINAQVPRLRELRIKKTEEPLAFYDGDVNGGIDIPDNVSLAATDASTTGGSLFTRYTNRTGTVGTNATRRTSKNRRREERKRARGKKGSVYEEEYLVNSIRRLTDRVNAVGDEVGRLIVGLMRRGMRERGKAVEGAMMEVVRLCKENIGEVFQNEENATADDVKPRKEETERPNGGDGFLWDSIEETQARREAPVIKEFEKLSLVGN